LDLELAKIQHENFVQLLRDLGLDVIELPADENCPNCVFIEDSGAIICNGIALLTKPEANRLPEVKAKSQR
jgi:dimethylargininase